MKIISHRGNTLKDLKEAIAQKVDEIEFDVRVTSDGIPVLHHDSQLLTPRGEKIKIAGSSLKLLKKSKSDLATLRDLFEMVDPKTPLYIEIKPGVHTEPIIKVLKDQLKKGRPANKLRVASFSQRILLEIHKALPEIPKIINESWNSTKARRRAAAVQTKQISMSQRWMWSGFVRFMRSRGYDLYAYTINTPRKAHKLQRYGLAGIVTDFPARFKNKH